MKRALKFLAVGLICALPLTACGGKTPFLNGSSVSETAPEAFANAQKGLTVGHLAYAAISNQINTAIAQGLLKGENAATVQVHYRKAKAALDLADTAERLGNTADLIAAVREANSAIAQAKSLVGVK